MLIITVQIGVLVSTRPDLLGAVRGTALPVTRYPNGMLTSG